tara:strand:+ start:22897 stop:23142 length:246 start_codon:yes stop_codon:yes gene_type:complete
MKKQQQAKIAKLEQQNMLLKMENEKIHFFLERIFIECLPVAKEIKAAKGFFKVFKVFKMAVYLAKAVIDFFEKKPEKITWY